MKRAKSVLGLISGDHLSVGTPASCSVFDTLEGRQLLSAAPIATFTGTRLHEHPGLRFSANIGTFVTPAPATGLVTQIDWGDGTTSTGKLVSDGIVGVDEINFELDGAHIYAKAGKYAITATVTKPGPVPTDNILVVATFSDRAFVTHSIALGGNISGTFSVAAAVPDVGADYIFSGTGTAGDLGAVTAEGSVKLPGMITSGRAGGTLTLTTRSTVTGKSGSVTLKLTGPKEKGFGPFPKTLSYVITSGTGVFARATGAGTIAASVGNSTSPNAFKFVLTSLMPTLTGRYLGSQSR